MLYDLEERDANDLIRQHFRPVSYLESTCMNRYLHRSMKMFIFDKVVYEIVIISTRLNHSKKNTSYRLDTMN